MQRREFRRQEDVGLLGQELIRTAGRQAAGLGSHREAAAQFERALRVADGEPPAVLAARYDALADELS